MNKNLAAVFLALAFASACFGLDITTRNGTTYRKCEVVKVEPDGIRIAHDAGAAKIEFEDMPDALKRQYNFDPSKVAAYRKTIADAKAAAEEKAKVERARLEAARQKDAANAKAAEDRRLAAERETAAAQEQERIKKEKAAGAVALGATTLTICLIAAACIAGLFVYFLPSIVGRHKSNATAIFLMNLFFGWSFIGWVVALIWACTKDVKGAVQTVIVHNNPPQPHAVPRAVPRAVVKPVAGRVIDPRQLPPQA